MCSVFDLGGRAPPRPRLALALPSRALRNPSRSAGNNAERAEARFGQGKTVSSRKILPRHRAHTQ